MISAWEFGILFAVLIILHLRTQTRQYDSNEYFRKRFNHLEEELNITPFKDTSE